MHTCISSCEFDIIIFHLHQVRCAHRREWPRLCVDVNVNAYVKEDNNEQRSPSYRYGRQICREILRPTYSHTWKHIWLVRFHYSLALLHR